MGILDSWRKAQIIALGLWTGRLCIYAQRPPAPPSASPSSKTIFSQKEQQ